MDVIAILIFNAQILSIPMISFFLCPTLPKITCSSHCEKKRCFVVISPSHISLYWHHNIENRQVHHYLASTVESNNY